MLKKLIFVAASALLVACGGETAKEWRAQHVIFIGLDGLTSLGVEKSETPNFDFVMQQGCYTMEKRTVLPSVSAPNWCAMFTGAPVEMFGRHDNSEGYCFKPLMLNERKEFQTVFSQFRKENPDAEMGCVTEWGNITCYIDSCCFNFVNVPSSSDIGCREGLETTIQYIKDKKPAMFFLQIDQIDHAGHGTHYDSEEYNKTVTLVDGMVGEIIQATKDAGIYDDCVFVLSSDHGGIEFGHGGITMNEMETMFAICGKGIKKGGQKITDTMMQFDVAPTIAKVFNLDYPQCWRGQAMDVFE